MTKYKTNAQKLKFFNDAKAARMPKAMFGKIMRNAPHPSDHRIGVEKPFDPTTKGELQKFEPRGPEDRLDPVTGTIRPKSFPKKSYTGPTPPPFKKYKQVTPKDIDFMLDPPTPKNPFGYMKKGGSVKRKKRK